MWCQHIKSITTMTLYKYYIIIIYLRIITCQDISICDDKNLTNVHGNTVNKEFCQENPCIISRYKEPCIVVKRIGIAQKRCEPMNEVSAKGNSTISRLQYVYKKLYGNIIKSEKLFHESFHIVTFKNKHMYNKICSGDWAISDFVHNVLYIMEDGSITIDIPNSGSRYQNIKKNKFIILFYAQETEHGLVPSVALKILENNDQYDLKGILVAIGMLVSSFFMLIVIIVYALLKELHNIFGFVLMAYMGTFCLAFLTKAVQSFGLWQRAIDVKTCLYLEPFVYFGILSSFMWMNVMSFDIWRKCRHTRSQRSVQRRNVLRKFMYYGLYAWLTPSLLVAAEVIIDHTDLSHLPNFKKPLFDTCSFYQISRTIYLLTPILLILIINSLLFCLTYYKIWTIRMELSRLNDNDHNDHRTNKKNENRFALFLRLSLVMGTNWIFEIVGALVDLPQWFENLVDTYNVLIGVFIFFLFVFKTNIFHKLCRKYQWV
ncbi:G-protein coupled receptor Mth2-like [Achroia grisella]|uniref:G-protein coupled receptor Mth2-like n=1 Tax=Achroia grisella TaxID=688607 RepID=UPI0027D21320|nr:G-protein coupled receptor Mth2-like [Achroia grisella]